MTSTPSLLSAVVRVLENSQVWHGMAGYGIGIAILGRPIASYSTGFAIFGKSAGPWQVLAATLARTSEVAALYSTIGHQQTLCGILRQLEKHQGPAPIEAWGL
jgi:hypothetical protein